MTDAVVEHRETPSQPSHLPENTLQRFGATVRRYRQQRGLTHKALATRMGIRRSSYISEIELGRRNIAVPMLLRLARALDIPVVWLLEGLDTYAGAIQSTTDEAPPSLGPDDQTILLTILGATIRQHRQQRQLLQAALAKMTGVSRSHICQIEQGNRSTSLLNLLSIAKAFELPVSSLLAPFETHPAVDAFQLKSGPES